MADSKVINCHWVGGSNNLPPNTRYIGRPGPYGNPYSSKSGQYTKEQCVALHKIHLYRQLCNKEISLAQLVNDLKNRDLACWCKQPKRVTACHGDNYLAVLDDSVLSRDYTKSVVHYLLTDLKTLTQRLTHCVFHVYPTDWFFRFEMIRNDLLVDLNYVLFFARVRNIRTSDVEILIAQVCVDLSLALQDTDPDVIYFRLEHAIWLVARFQTSDDLIQEPLYPHLPIGKTKRKKT